MSAKSKDLTGMRFGNLVVIEKADGLQDRYYTWRCCCDCGNEIEMTESDFVFGCSVSCGCVRQQRWEEFLPSQ